MNTWRDIKADPPELNIPILVTDGESVFFGRAEKYDSSSRIAFHGANIEDGFTDSFWSDEPEEWDKLQWQPAPDTWKPEETADEMFRAEKYTIKEEHDGHTVYKTGQRCHIQKKICIDKNLNFTKHWKLSATCENQTFSKGEILACAQLIREMEANNG